MKTRNEIYQGEGAQLLRFITTYHSLQYEQVLRLFSKNRESIKSLITSLVKQKRIIYDKENGLLFDSQESANNPDYGISNISLSEISLRNNPFPLLLKQCKHFLKMLFYLSHFLQ